MAHTPGNHDDDNDENDDDDDDGDQIIGLNLYDKVPHVTLEVKADQQSWMRSWKSNHHK